MEALNKADHAPGNKKGQLRAASRRYQGEENKYLTEAIKIYALIANKPRFKNYPRMDEALFYYAYTLQGAKHVALSRKVYHQLIKDYPNSKYIPFAYLVVRRLLLQRQPAGRRREVLQQGPRVPALAHLPLRPVQEGLGLPQPRPLAGRARDLLQRGPEDPRGRKNKQIFNASDQRLRPRLRRGRPAAEGLSGVPAGRPQERAQDAQDPRRPSTWIRARPRRPSTPTAS